jgi:hypothetical protein
MTARAEAATEHRAAGVVQELVRRLLSTLVIATVLIGCGYHEAPAGATLEESSAPAQPPMLAEPPSPAEPLSLAEQAWFGAFTYGGVWQGMEPVARLELELGRGLDVVHWFMSWDHAFDPEPLQAVLAGGRVPLISWQPMHQDLHDITAGHHDDYLRSWAQGIKNAPGTVYLRPFPEMNGDWVPWNGDPQALRDAWTHVTTLFANEGAHNVRWVWSPNVTDEPRTDHNRMENYYPGHDHVHVLALSGYNWGDTRPTIGWRSFEEIIEGAYDRLVRLGPQPVWMAETASSEVGGDKAAWIGAMFASAADFPRLEAIVWFPEDKETDWRIESSEPALRAFARALGAHALREHELGMQALGAPALRALGAPLP